MGEQQPLTLGRFYARRARAESPEQSFGDSWRDAGHGPWGVSWLEDTGELVAFALGPTGIEMGGGTGTDAVGIAMDLTLGLFLAHAFHKAQHVEEVRILGVESDETKVRERIEGWESHQGDENGLAWLKARFEPEGGSA